MTVKKLGQKFSHDATLHGLTAYNKANFKIETSKTFQFVKFVEFACWYSTGYCYKVLHKTKTKVN